jgi:hypothetical protein
MLLAASSSLNILISHLSFTEDYLENVFVSPQYVRVVRVEYWYNGYQFPAGTSINDLTLSRRVQVGLGITHSHVLWLWGYISRDKAARA